MVLRLAPVLAALTVALTFPTGAPAKTTYRAAVRQSNVLGSPVSPVSSMDSVPLGFATTARQAVAAAERSPVMQELHRREHPLQYMPYVWHLGALYWYLTFSYQGHVAAQVNVSPRGRLLAVWTGPQALAPYARGHYAPGFDRWWVILSFSLAFLVPFIDPRRWRRMLHLDALVLLSFLASYLLLDHAHLQSAVWMAYPPLVYLLGRMLWLGLRRARSEGKTIGGPRPRPRFAERLAPLLSTRLLLAGLLILVGGRIALSLLSGQEIDVGYASLLGAHRIAHGMPLYLPDPGHGDTYGPITYLAYLPFERLFGTPSNWTSNLWPADLASLTFDLTTILGLFFLGRRLGRQSGRPGPEARVGTRGNLDGTRLGLVLAWAWAACPFTLLGLMVHTNDGLIALLSVLSLLVFASPAARGAVLGLAAAAKFSPAALLPLYARGRQRPARTALICLGAFTALVALTIWLYLPPGGLSEFYDRTLGFQLTRPDVFSPWALHPGLEPLKLVLEGAAVLLAVLVAFFPRSRTERSLAQVCALAGAVTIAVQLPAIHWFYYYILWFLPFVLVALLPGQSDQPSAVDADGESLTVEDRRPEPVLAGV